MGIPMFYSWLMAKDPSLVESTHMGCYDNLYLDVNQIIYQVIHPMYRQSSDTTVIETLCNYVDCIFELVHPTKVVYMAIDGVAPRAKMNKQRSSRFKAVKAASDADIEENKLREIFAKEGKRLPYKNSKGVYFSNLVAPGTSFMVDISTALKDYAHRKLKDERWKNIKFIISDANVPGEGEHKIMSYIRLQKGSSEYDATTKHCIYGSDADLLMLCLANHIRNISILIKFGTEDYKTTHQFLNLGRIRGFIEEEIMIKKSLFTADDEIELKRRIDDFVCMCFLLGNDFLPNIPSLVISQGAIDLLISVYKQTFVVSREYLTDSGTPNLKNLERFIQAMGCYEVMTFRIQTMEYKAQLEEIKTCQSSHQSLPAANSPPCFFSTMMIYRSYKKELYDNNNELKKKLKELIHQKSDTFSAGYDLKEDKVRLGETGWKERYYKEKFLASTDMEIDAVKKQAVLKYVEGLCWLMQYYYKGIGSWKWYYPYHYAPFASDFKDIGDLNITFELGSPLKPFTQMLAISPPSNSIPLPKKYKKLITDSNSPIKDFYPSDFEIDTDGKRYTWEGIVKLPFIDEDRLLDEVAKIQESEEDILLNSTTSEVVVCKS